MGLAKGTYRIPGPALALLTALLSSQQALADTRTTRFLQADSAADVTLSQGTFSTQHAGYTGTGFADGASNATAFIEWTNVRIQSPGSKKLSFRYANGSGATRNAEISVNGTVVAANQAFAATAGWTTWAVVSVTGGAFVVGNNTIRIRGTSVAGLANIDRVDVIETSEPVADWGIAVVESQMLRTPNAAASGWGYAYALFLHGIYLTYQRTGDPRYLRYIKSWVDGMIGPQGNIYTSSAKTTVRSLDALDFWFPGTVVLDVYNHHPSANYRTALQTIRNRYSESGNTSGGQPTWTSRYWNGGGTNPDGGYQHRSSTPNQLWLDGVFMSSKYLRLYGDKFGGSDKTFADDTTALQLLATFKHLEDAELCQTDSTCGGGGVCVKLGGDAWGRCSADDTPGTTGLLWHAYDKDGDPNAYFVNAGENSSNFGAEYASAEHTQEHWCRAMGWFSVASVDALETMAPAHPERPDLVALVRGLADSLATFQDGSGRWFQVVNRQTHPDNWTETSCSAMYAYMMKKGRTLGVITSSAIDASATSAYNGVLAKISYTFDSGRAADLTNLADTSEGTNLGDAAYYFARPRVTNDNHGLGAFLMMYEYFRTASPPVCGNLICEAGETSTSCPADCPPPPVCGNLICEAGETSTSCPADCPPTGGTVVANPQADAHVRDGSSASTNFGGASSLEVKFWAGGTGNTRNAFLRFSLAGVAANVTSAKVRLFGNSVTTAKALSAYAVADVGWGETSITFNTQPALGVKIGNSVSVGLNAGYHEFDVTSYVQSQKAAGATAVGFAFKQDTSNNETPTSFNSKEGASKPELVIQSQ